MERYERIAKAIAASGKRKSQIAAECGVSPAAVSQWLSGESRSMRPESIYSLAKATGYSPEWIAIGSGPEKPENLPTAGAAPSEDEYALIPQFNVRGHCGPGILNEHVTTSEGLAFKRDWLRKMGVKPENLFVIYAHGDSMEPYIFEGDVVLFDASQNVPQHKHVYVIRRPDGGNSIKRLIQNLSGSWVIRSDNPDKNANPDEAVSDVVMHDLPIIGRVIWRGGGIS
ncbi:MULTISPECIES: S24 family peptidase [unclassified Pseudomonas]|uniref:LexA family transcriptional regulator n=1 Tax=unclassified Pseudomonas TaxID=196821 RepID=UPI00257D6B72|nr:MULTISPECIES: S24 family peptidase [unclassified Pseudomonas]